MNAPLAYDDTITHVYKPGAGQREMHSDLVLRSGYVDRYHTTPELKRKQDNSQHQWRVAVIILQLHPNPSLPLLREALLHDSGELFMGDMPGPTKARHPEIKLVTGPLEDQYRMQMGATPAALSPEDRAWLSFADLAECIGVMRMHAPQLEMRSDWAGAVNAAMERGRSLGLCDDDLVRVMTP